MMATMATIALGAQMLATAVMATAMTTALLMYMEARMGALVGGVIPRLEEEEVHPQGKEDACIHDQKRFDE